MKDIRLIGQVIDESGEAVSYVFYNTENGYKQFMRDVLAKMFIESNQCRNAEIDDDGRIRCLDTSLHSLLLYNNNGIKQDTRIVVLGKIVSHSNTIGYSVLNQADILEAIGEDDTKSAIMAFRATNARVTNGAIEPIKGDFPIMGFFM